MSTPLEQLVTVIERMEKEFDKKKSMEVFGSGGLYMYKTMYINMCGKNMMAFIGRMRNIHRNELWVWGVKLFNEMYGEEAIKAFQHRIDDEHRKKLEATNAIEIRHRKKERELKVLESQLLTLQESLKWKENQLSKAGAHFEPRDPNSLPEVVKRKLEERKLEESKNNPKTSS